MSKIRGLIKALTNYLYNSTNATMDKFHYNDKIREYLNGTNFTEDFKEWINTLPHTDTNVTTTYIGGSTTTNSNAGDEPLPIIGKVCGYLALTVCVFGTIANILNIAVLTRKDMVCTPVNRILTGLAVADMMVMLEYIPFAYYYYFVLPRKQDYPYPWAVYMLFHTNFAQVIHTISICLTLALAIWRYIAIRYPEKSHVLCTEKQCTLAITISYILPILLCSPSYLLTVIRKTTVQEQGENFHLYHLDLSDIAKNNTLFYVSCVWTYSVFIKLLPCVILTVISNWLIRALCKAKRRKQILRGYNACPTTISTTEVVDGPPPEQQQQQRRPNKSERRTERTTKMLVAVLLLFLITEFPQGILALLSGIYGKEFFREYYHHVTGDFMDILALLNGAINFILYCSMSRQFRQNFGQLFKPKILAKWPPVSQTEIHTTYV